MKHLFAVLIFVFSIVTINAQSKKKSEVIKIAHYNVDSLLNLMPEFHAAADSSILFYRKLEPKMTQLLTDSAKLMDEITNGNLPNDQLELKKKELEALQIEMHDYLTFALKAYVDYKTKVLQPVFDKMTDAAVRIAKEKGYIFLEGENNSDNSGIPNSKTYNIFKDMCKELGIPIPKKK